MKYLIRTTLILLVCFLQITNSRSLKNTEPTSDYKAKLYKNFIEHLNSEIACDKKLTPSAYNNIVDLAAKVQKDPNNIFEIAKLITAMILILVKMRRSSSSEKSL
jgi:hypothetical protein